MGRLSFAGPDALALIQHVYTNDAATMKDGQVRYGLICNEQGGVRDDVLVYRWPYGYAMVVNAGNREKIVAWLAAPQGDAQRRGQRPHDGNGHGGGAGAEGDGAVPRPDGRRPVRRSAYYHAAPTIYRGQACVVSRTGYTGEDGVEIIVPAEQGVSLFDELTARGATPCGLGARDTLRLEAAMPLYGHELTEEIDPLQAGLGWAVKLDKGDFIGRDALLRGKQDKTRPVRVGLELEGKRIAREGAAVLRGRLGRSAASPAARSPRRCRRRSRWPTSMPACAAVGTALAVDVRGKAEAARVVGLPFYRRPQT